VVNPVNVARPIQPNAEPSVTPILGIGSFAALRVAAPIPAEALAGITSVMPVTDRHKVVDPVAVLPLRHPAEDPRAAASSLGRLNAHH
jgi:hypothetical protein